MHDLPVRSDACIVAYRSKSANRSEDASHCEGDCLRSTSHLTEKKPPQSPKINKCNSHPYWRPKILGRKHKASDNKEILQKQFRPPELEQRQLARQRGDACRSAAATNVCI